MATPVHSTGAANRADKGPGAAQVLTFPNRPAAPARGPAIAAPAAARVNPAARHLTSADHAALAAWMAEGSHGYHRVHVEREVQGQTTPASFALVYVAEVAWSVWGLARQGAEMEVWRCATGETVGRYPSMAAALASLPHASDHRRKAAGQAGPARVRRAASGTR